MKLLLFAAFVAWFILGDQPPKRERPKGQPTEGFTEQRCNPYKACTGRVLPE